MTSAAVGEPMNSAQACERAKISYRQCDHWVRRGAITPSATEGPGGSGSIRLWNAQDVAMLAAIGRVYADLAELDLEISVPFVRRLWTALEGNANVVWREGTVTISVGLTAQAIEDGDV